MVTERRHLLDVEPIYGRVRTTADPTATAVTVAVLPIDQIPKPADWMAAAWNGPAVTAYDPKTARTWYYANWATTQPYTTDQRGTLEAHVKIIDGAFTIVLKAGEVEFRP